MYNIYSKSGSGKTVLHIASQRGKTDIVEKLLEAGADTSKDDRDNRDNRDKIKSDSEVLNIHTK
jgi:ankyrin repeat protein